MKPKFSTESRFSAAACASRKLPAWALIDGLAEVVDLLDPPELSEAIDRLLQVFADELAGSSLGSSARAR